MNKEDLIRYLERQEFPEHIVKAFEEVKRENFVPKESQRKTYENIPLPIGKGQTISQPYTMAFMLMMLEIPSDKKARRIMEVGSGSGYVLALLNQLNPKGENYGIERFKELVDKSREALEPEIDKGNVEVIQGDGSKGLPEKTPFDRILVSARCETIPQKLVNQLKYNGILVAPVGNSIIMVKKKSGQNEINEYPGFSFVPLVEEE